MNKVSFEAFQGNTFTRTLTFLDSAGAAVNITGYTFYVTIKEQPTDADADALYKADITSLTDPTHGIATITIDAADTVDLTGTKYIDIVYKKPASGGVFTAANGTISFAQSITQRASA